MIVFDLDDMASKHSWNAWEDLVKLREMFPKFKVTLFTIPGETTLEDALFWSSHDWVELAVHGFSHRLEKEVSPWECDQWTYEEAISFLSFMEHFYPKGTYVKGFKAPGWKISDGLLKALKDFDWWVADQDYNNKRRPTGLKYRLLQDADTVHGHTWDCCGNGVKELIEHYFPKISKETQFKFISEMIHD